MNIFIIPSWYPSKVNPTNGIFVKEQALAMSKQRPDWHIWLSLWGQEDMDLPLSKCWRWPLVAARYRQLKKRGYNSLKPNLTELYKPVLHWNETYFRSHPNYFADLLEAHRQNLLQALRQKKVDCIHAHVVAPAGLIARELSLEFKIPYIITEHTGLFPPSSFLQAEKKLRTDIELAYLQANCVIGVSPFQTQNLQNWQIQSVTVPNSIDDTLFQPKSIKNQKRSFFTLAVNLTEEKGIKDLLYAIAQLKENKPEYYATCEFKIAGNDKGNFNQMAHQLGINTAIHWLGPINRSEAAEQMAACSYFVLPSHHESLGMVFIEAMFCGKPVVATSCGGPEYSVNNATGLLVPIKNVEKLTNALEEIGKKTYDPVAIRAHAMEHFSEKRITALLEEIYLSTIN